MFNPNGCLTRSTIWTQPSTEETKERDTNKAARKRSTRGTGNLLTLQKIATARRSVTSVAKELGLRDSVPPRWVDKVRQETAPAAWRPTTPPMSADQASEIARLRQENERLRMERDVLKKSRSRSLPEPGHELPLHQGPPATPIRRG
jgi:transposase